MGRVYINLVICITLLTSIFLAGCRHSNDLTTAGLPGHLQQSQFTDPDKFLEVDCLLPGQVRKLGSMVYASPRRPMKTTAGDCEIRGGEYVVFDRANYKDALAIWMIEAESGNPEAQNYVGEIYLKSPPEDPRYDLAAKWFQKAADSGFTRAQVNLGYLYENGFGVEQNSDKALFWYTKSSGAQPEEIMQQHQMAASEREELAELKQRNALQLKQLTALRNEKQGIENSLKQAQTQLQENTNSIAEQQHLIDQQNNKLQSLQEFQASQQTTVNEDIAAEIATLKKSLQKKEVALLKQKRLASQLNSQILSERDEANHLAQQVATLNGKFAQLPGPKIEILDPQLLRTRGIIVAPIKEEIQFRSINGKIWAPAGLNTFLVNGQKTLIENDGTFSSKLPITSDDLSVDLLAVDLNGNKDELKFSLKKQPSSLQRNATSEQLAQQTAEDVHFGKYYALVIGNNNYRMLPKLQTAVEDAQVVGKLLQNRYGFEVEILLNANRNAILSALNEYRKKLTEKDNLLIYYAGHGTLEERNTQGFWLPVDSDLDSDVNWIPTDRITGIMNLMSAKQILVIADACYSGIMTRTSLTHLESGKSTEAYNKWLKKMAAYKSRVIISSGETKPVLDGGGGKHSVFAKALLDTLTTNQKILLGIDLHRAIAEKVVDASGKLGLDQVPQYAGLNRAGHELGDFLFVPSGG